MSEGLTQEDFRKLMATPRRPNNEESSEPNNSIPSTPKKTGTVFAKPHALRRKAFQKNTKKEPKDDEEEEEKDLNYRDRAAERRQQENEQDDSQLTTEELLRRTQKEVDEELNPQQLYEQSKYLGGDVSHTHLVKGLDFALLKKVRSDMSKADVMMEVEEDAEPSIEEETEKEKENQPMFHTIMAKNIHDLIMHETQDVDKRRVELFERGRMGFVFELADEIGHYSDAFALPTALIRSKADTDAKSNASDLFAEMNLVIEKISQVMTNVRHGERKKTTLNRSLQAIVNNPIPMFEGGFDGDIFADAGRDYQLDETALQPTPKHINEETEEKGTGSSNKESYFKGLAVEDEMAEDEDQPMAEVQDTVASILSQVKDEKKGEEQPQKKRKVEKETHSMNDDDAADIDMFGLGTSALPTSFDEHSRTAYQSDDDDEEEEGKNKTRLIDHGTNRNKKAQLTRWDFDTDEEWQKYKDTIEILPKSAIQFGVKMNDGRKRNKEKRSMSDKQRLDRDYQQVKNIMSQKYGKSLDK
ncbi:RED-like protein N-terminal region-domain-containing protein [Sporodiniella umbellata]|nr:RED-like protein N-terminal region-domain-containing protein [Sporodiniella umbellata]